jgi:flagellar biosynthesis/type III secretory pathway protein FliH
MSSFEDHRRHAMRWSLDEFAAADVFSSDVLAPVDAPEAPAADDATIAAEFARRLDLERARVETDAYDRGRADGEHAERARLEAQLSVALSALQAVSQSLAKHEALWASTVEENMAALAVSIARHIVQREIVADPSLVAQLVASALARYPADQEVTIRLAPDDMVLCRPILEAAPDGGRTLRWIADASINRGGCLTEGRERIIEGRIDTALERIYRALAGVQT